MRLRTVAFLVTACLFWVAFPQQRTSAQQLFRAESPNFTVFAPDPAFAKKVSKEAERFRQELAIEWLGKELPQWKEKCPIRVSLSPHSGGETSFAFLNNGPQRAEPNGWEMKVFGTPERILDSVLPHEITHTVFATHFKRPLPRWADEGACTTVEHAVEKQKNHQMLVSFLSASPSRGIPFNRMFTMRDYPPDILPLYAQGFSVAKFLIMQKGRRHFLDYLETGLELERPGQVTRAWDQATRQHYGYQDLSELQVRWQRWVADGSQESVQRPAEDALPPPIAGERMAKEELRILPQSRPDKDLENVNRGWYARQMKVGSRTRSYFPPQPAKLNNRTIWR